MYSKSKPYQSIKGEKENENIQLRKKTKNLTTDKTLTNKKETVWDRLSKTKKVPSTENVAAGRARANFTGKTPQRFQSVKHSSFKQFTQPTIGPLVPTYSTINKSLTQKIIVNQPNVQRDFDKPTYLHALPVKKVITARSLSGNSNSSSESAVDFFRLSNESLRFNNHKVYDSSEDSDEVYTLAPLLASCSEDGSKACMRTINNVSEYLRLNKSMALEDIELVRDVIKSDSKCENLEKNPKVFKDILKTQLQNILMQEFSTNKALAKLESSVSLRQSIETESTKPRNKIMTYSGHNKEIKKFEVDVIFKNVPSLDKEIEILRTLGEKLEATLKCMPSFKTRYDAVSEISIVPNINSLLVTEEKDPPKMFKLKYEVHDAIAENNAEFSFHLIGIRQCMGIVNEFCMTQKSIVELKREFNRPFYIRVNSESTPLIRTSFKKLKENPNELLRHVKPKNSQVAFNILEQDPMFFYNAFNKLSNVPYLLSTKHDHCEEYEFPIKKTLSVSGNTIFWNTSNQEVPPKYEKLLVDKKESEDTNFFTSKSEYNSGNKFFNTLTISEPVIQGKQRRRIRRRVTPMPIDYNFCPKNSFFKTILVGFVQMLVFIVFIMALTYPGVKC